MTDLTTLVTDGLIRESVPIGSHTTYRLGGPARYFAAPSTTAELIRVIEAVDDLPVLVLGRGSNLVISDEGYEGVVVKLAGEFETIEVDPEGVVEAGGAAWLPSLARASVDAGRRGLEFFVGIPGSVGGAVRQNAGGHGAETRDVLIEADIVHVRTAVHRSATPHDLAMTYRSSSIGPDDLVVSARFGTEPGSPEGGRAKIAEIVAWRKEHQPAAIYNAGSVFRNPEGDSAGRIIDSLGLKGYRVGGVRVSEKHANFFVADPDATAADLWRLVGEVRSQVSDRTGVDLHPEIQFVGAFE